jgi:hypothetical protein
MRKGTKHTKNYRGSPLERFWSKVNKTPTCWVWTAAKANKGYGVMRIDGKNIRAHIFSYEVHLGPVLDGVFVCHRCDNPPCVNPQHLFLGTNHENVKDMVSKKRHTYGEKNPQSKLTEYDVMGIFKSKSEGMRNSDIARVVGVSQTTICQILKGNRWGHLKVHI